MPNADAEIAARLRLAATRLHRQLRREAGVDLTPSQTSALAAIDHHGPLTLGSLAEHENVSAPSITKVTTVLEQAGLVERRADPADRRVQYISATREGSELVAESRRRKTAWLTSRIHELSPTQRGQLADALDVLDALTAREPSQREQPRKDLLPR